MPASNVTRWCPIAAPWATAICLAAMPLRVGAEPASYRPLQTVQRSEWSCRYDYKPDATLAISERMFPPNPDKPPRRRVDAITVRTHSVSASDLIRVSEKLPDFGIDIMTQADCLANGITFRFSGGLAIYAPGTIHVVEVNVTNSGEIASIVVHDEHISPP